MTGRASKSLSFAAPVLLAALLLNVEASAQWKSGAVQGPPLQVGHVATSGQSLPCQVTAYDPEVFQYPNGDIGILAQGGNLFLTRIPGLNPNGQPYPGTCRSDGRDSFFKFRWLPNQTWASPATLDCPALTGDYSACGYFFPSPAIDSPPLASPSIVKVGGRYFMAVVGLGRDYGRGEIFWAVSNDAVNWDFFGGPGTWKALVSPRYPAPKNTYNDGGFCPPASDDGKTKPDNNRYGVGQVTLSHENGWFYLHFNYLHAALDPIGQALEMMGWRIPYNAADHYGLAYGQGQFFIKNLGWVPHSGSLVFDYDGQAPVQGDPVLHIYNQLSHIATPMDYGAGDVKFHPGHGYWLRLYSFGGTSYTQRATSLAAENWSPSVPVNFATIESFYPGAGFYYGGLWYGSWGKRTGTWVVQPANYAHCSTFFEGLGLVMAEFQGPNELAGLTVSPTGVPGGTSAIGTVTLTGPAASPGAVVTLSSGSPSQASVPATVTVPTNQLSAMFLITTALSSVVASIPITASYGGTSIWVDFRVTPTVRRATRVVPPRPVIGGGNSATFSVEIDQPAPPAGTVVSLTSSAPSAATVPVSVTVPSGAISAPFVVTTNVVASSTPVTITASAGGSTVSASFTVAAPVYQGFLDVADCSGLAGWAWDANRPNTPITVDIYANGARQATGVPAGSYRSDLVAAGIGNGYHAFSWTLPLALKTGATYSMVVNYGGTSTPLGATPKSITCPPPSVTVAWVKPSSASWGPPNTLTVAGYARNGTGSVQMVWREDGGPWNVVAWQPTPDSLAQWSNTIPRADYCHDFDVYANYSGVSSAIFSYKGLTAGYCTENARVIWLQPDYLFNGTRQNGLVAAGSATGAPPGTVVRMYWLDLASPYFWNQVAWTPVPDANGIWYNMIQNIDYTHSYMVYVKYDAFSSTACTYPGSGQIKWC